MKKGKSSKILWLFCTLSTILFIGLIIFTLINNNRVRDIISQRDTRLDVYEVMKQGVLDDLRNYLCVTEDNYIEVKSKINMTNSLKESLFGSKYKEDRFLGAESISFIDAQYSIISDKDYQDDMVIYYVSCNVLKNKNKNFLEFLMYIKDNKIFDILKL